MPEMRTEGLPQKVLQENPLDSLREKPKNLGLFIVEVGVVVPARPAQNTAVAAEPLKI